MVNPKLKGSNFERVVKKLIQKQEPQTEVFRSPASLGSADLVTIRKWEYGSFVRLIQCKYLRKYMTKKGTDEIVSDAKRIGAEAYLAYRERPRGTIYLDQLWPDVIPKILSSKSWIEISG